MKISYRQMCILTFLSFIALKFLALPSLLYTVSGNMSYWVALIMMAIDGLYVLIILGLMRKCNEKNIYTFMQKNLGTVLSKIICFMFVIKLLMRIANISKGLEFFVTSNLYEEFKWYNFAIPLATLLGFMVYKGIRNVARVGELIYWGIFVGIIYIVIKAIPNVDFGFSLPMFQYGATPIFEAMFKYSAWFGSGTFLLLLFGKVDFKNQNKSRMFWFIIAAIVIVELMYITFYGLFEITSSTHNFCISDISQYTGGHTAVDELAWLVVSLWVVAQAVQLALFGCCFLQAFKCTFNVRKSLLPTIILVCFIVFISFIGSKTIVMEKIFFSQVASIFSISIQYIVPLIIGAGYLINRRKNEKT